MRTETNVTKMNLAELTALVLALQERIVNLAELTALVLELQERIVKLETPKVNNTSAREMTDDDARRIMTGDLADKKHKDAAEALGLSYGQIYSCRLGFTFKAIHKELAAIAGYKNAWMK